MSIIADQVFSRLKTGESPEAVRKSVSNASKFTNGLVKYLQWAELEARRIRTEIDLLQEKKRQLQTSLQILEKDQNEMLEKIGKLRDDDSEAVLRGKEQQIHLDDLQKASKTVRLGLKISGRIYKNCSVRDTMKRFSLKCYGRILQVEANYLTGWKRLRNLKKKPLR